MSLSTPLSTDDILFGLIVALIIIFAAIPVTRRSAEQKVMMLALTVKLIVSVIYSVLILHSNGADSLVYHANGVYYADQLRADLAQGSIDYFVANPPLWIGEDYYNISNFSGIIHFFLFDSFLGSTFAFALIGYLGQLLIYKTFVSYYPDPRLRLWWRVGILFFPTLTFWSTGILKDPLGILGLGCVLWGMRNLLDQARIRHVALAVFGFWMFIVFRPQIAPVMLLAVVPWVLQTGAATGGGRMVSLRGVGAVRLRLVFVAVGVLAFLALGFVHPSFSLANLPRTITEQNAGYQRLSGLQSGVYAPIQPLVTNVTWIGLLLAWPSAFVITMYRPFPWEAASIPALMASFENLILLALTLRLLFVLLTHRGIVQRTVRSPLFLTSVIFVVLFSLGVGASTPNLGTISRYRIPLIPFVSATFIIVEYYLILIREELKVSRNAVQDVKVLVSR